MTAKLLTKIKNLKDTTKELINSKNDLSPSSTLTLMPSIIKRPKTTNFESPDPYPGAKTVSISDDEAFKRWFSDIWKAHQVVPFELLTLESFLLTYYDFSYPQIQRILRNKKDRYSLLYVRVLAHVACITDNSLFNEAKLKPFLQMCKRNFTKQQKYNEYISALITSTMKVKPGYFIDQEMYDELSTTRRKHNVKVVVGRTQSHTIISWLLNGKMVYVPDAEADRVGITTNFDAYTKDDKIDDLWIGYGACKFTSLQPNVLESLTNTDLNWFIALNNQMDTKLLGLSSPIEASNGYTPHSATIEFTQGKARRRVGIIINVDNEFYNQHCNKHKMLNLWIGVEKVYLNHVPFPMLETDIELFRSNLMICCERTAGNLLVVDEGTPLHLHISKPIIKPAVFTSNMLRKKMEIKSALSHRIYKIVNVASKASGKTHLINAIKAHLQYPIFVEDSDDYGKFLTWLTETYKTQSVFDLDSKITEMEYVLEAERFAEMLYEKEGECELPSYINSIVEGFVSNRFKDTNSSFETVFADLKTPRRILFRAEREYFYIKDSINAFYVKMCGLKTINQKFFEQGIHRFMESKGLKVHVSFLHLLLDNYARAPADIAMKYSPNIDASVTIFQRSMEKEMTDEQFFADVLLKMFYDQSSESVTPIIGPTALVQLFGVVPVLKKEATLRFCYEGISERPGFVENSDTDPDIVA